MPVKLSVVIITYNEEKNLSRCLQSLNEVADEIVVVDSGSQDKTKEVAISFGAKVFHQNWLGYSQQKNLGNSIAENDWILSLDADECLSTELADEIKKWKNNPVAAYLNRLTNYCGSWIRHGSWFPDRKLRLFNRKQAQWLGDIHERIEHHSKTKALHLKGLLYHYSYHTVQEHWKQLDKFTTLTAEKAFKEGKKSSLFSQFISPIWRFFRDYIVKLGILDGAAGFTIARISAYGVYLKHKKIRHLWAASASMSE
jgi:glycosyltransferase involved in cell wall biosynthesis